MPEKTLTIIFRGLMVFRQQGNDADSHFEIGIVPVPGPDHPPHHIEHIPRISTFVNGALESVKILKGVQTSHRVWHLEVDGPDTAGVSKDQQGATFNRTNHPFDRDYRWLMDLEDNTEFYGPLVGKIDTGKLKPVIHIPNGVFYTRLRSVNQLREKDGVSGQEDFGRVASAIACDINLTGAGAKLKTDAGVQIFNFKAEENTLYDFANTPPDTHVPAPSVNEDHFQHYYDMFTTRVPKFHFKEPNPDPAPRPALCGATGLGQFPNSL